MTSMPEGRGFRQAAMERLAELPGFDWCGIYRLEGETLVLDAFVGEPTEHTQIPVGVGVCGEAVAQGRDKVVDDVNSLENYLSCSLQTKSEIVVLVRGQDGAVLGQIDIDSHQPSRFGDDELEMLRNLAKEIAEKW